MTTDGAADQVAEYNFSEGQASLKWNDSMI